MEIVAIHSGCAIYTSTGNVAITHPRDVSGASFDLDTGTRYQSRGEVVNSFANRRQGSDVQNSELAVLKPNFQ